MATLRFEGGKELEAALKSLSTRVSRRIQREALYDAAEPMRRAMAAKAPHAPGKPDLRDTMTISDVREEGNQAVAIGPSKVGFYGSFHEFGSANQPAIPWARPAFDEKVETALQVLAREIWTALAARGVSRSVTRDVPVSGGPSGGLT